MCARVVAAGDGEPALPNGDVAEQRPGDEVARFARERLRERRFGGLGLVEARERGGAEVVGLRRVVVDVKRAVHVGERGGGIAGELALRARAVELGETLAAEARPGGDQHDQRGRRACGDGWAA